MMLFQSDTLARCADRPLRRASTRRHSRGPWSARTRLGVALTLVAAVLAGCRRDGSPTAPPLAKDFNVLLITIDTLRADHLGCYGHPVIKTPNIDRLAREGVQFNQCTASAPITLPSHCSIMLGTEPYIHGVRVNGAYPLNEPNITLAEILREQGYRTGARVGAYVLHERWGLNQGFEDYESVDIPDADKPVPEQGGGIGRIGDQGIFAERRADAVRESAARWLGAHAKDKFFLWVHFFDPHKPYDPPEPYRTAYVDPYLGEIAFTDEQVGHLLGTLQGLNLDNRTLVVLLADHGEGLGEHGELTHMSFVYDATMRVPLVLRCPGKIPGNGTIDAQVRTIDIVPTILAFLGLPPKSDAQGVSLLPLVSGQASDPKLAAYGESFFPHFSLGLAQSRCVRADGWKYIHLPEPELYHVAEDPQELKNLAPQYPDRVEEMRDQLHTLLAEAPPRVPITPPGVELTPREIRRLAALGYISISPEAAAKPSNDELAFFEPRGDDPKRHTDQIELFARGIGAVQVRDYPLAEQIFSKLAEQGIQSPHTVRWYAEALTEQNKIDQAIDAFKHAVEKEPDFADGYNDWGLLLDRKGRSAEAVEKYRQAVRLAPKMPFFRINLANTLVDLGQLDEAEKLFNDLLQEDAKNADAFNGLGNVLARRNELEPAIRMYNQAVALDPQRPLFYITLGQAFATQRQADKAVESFRRALAVNPGYADAYLCLGRLFFAQDRLDEAVEMYREMLRRDATKAPTADALGLMLTGRGDYRRAITVFRGLVAMAPAYQRAANNLAWLLATAPDATLRNGPEAVKLAEPLVLDTQRKQPGLLDTLAAAYAEAGQFDKAIQALQEAVNLVSASENAALASEMRARLALYRQQKPYREQARDTTATQSNSE